MRQTVPSTNIVKRARRLAFHKKEKSLGKRNSIVIHGFCASLIFAIGSIQAGQVSVPNTFNSGETTSAAHVNSNFSALENAINDNDIRIAALEGSTDKVFQGFSATTVDGSAGIFAMAEACDDSFSGSKVCTTREVMNSVHNESAGSHLTSTAWLFPDLLPQDTGAAESTTGRIESQSINYFACSGWGATNNTGTTISPSGRISLSTCGQMRPVACCK